jgi:hypothetical protein
MKYYVKTLFRPAINAFTGYFILFFLNIISFAIE